jgi:hypothetical protein
MRGRDIPERRGYPLFAAALHTGHATGPGKKKNELVRKLDFLNRDG